MDCYIRYVEATKVDYEDKKKTPRIKIKTDDIPLALRHLREGFEAKLSFVKRSF